MSIGTDHIRAKEKGSFLLIVGIMLFASNLRAPLTSIGSLVPEIRESLGVSSTVMGAISTLPLLAFAFVSPFAPKIANRFGIEKTIFLSMIMLALGIVVRSVTGISALFIGTAMIGIMISFGNVLLPGLIKMSFPFQIGLMTGLYALFMNIFGALASGISVPLSNNFGWQVALGVWVILIIITLFIWYPQLKKTKPQIHLELAEKKQKTNMWTSFTAWQVTLFMGLQSLMYFTCLTWLPDILQSNGYSSNQAGWMLSLMLFALIPVNFLIPVISDKLNNQKLLGALTGIVFLLGTIGLFSSHFIVTIMSAVFIGIGCGSGYSLSMMLFTLRTKNGYDASELSGMAQSFGYFIAALGPIIFGGLHDLVGSWITPLFMLLITGIMILITGVLAGRKVIINN
ncbi:CynX/NimT family MFS transporter [Pseudogracilibacillus sp. SO30301A]|uniref:CynX/NimT family MFS transporter n=1 Tax=Pseudogracilibacillus sp. SO30301A TaxID=3098291 RepID=UPI00300E6169